MVYYVYINIILRLCNYDILYQIVVKVSEFCVFFVIFFYVVRNEIVNFIEVINISMLDMILSISVYIYILYRIVLIN